MRAVLWLCMLHVAWASSIPQARTAAFVPLFAANVHSRPSTRLAFRGPRPVSRNLPKCSAIKDIKSWESEFGKLKAPLGGTAVGAGGGDILQQFGNMLQGVLKQADQTVVKATIESDSVKSGPVSEVPRLDGHAVLNEFPHVRESFTQGLWWDEDERCMWEGSGSPAFSCGTRVTKYDLETGKIKMGRQLPDRYFGEGVCGLGDKIYQLSWRTKVGFIYDKKTLKLLDSWKYDHEGWGITTDGKELIVSDGTATLHFLDPKTMQEIRTLVVRTRQAKSNSMAPLRRLNDLQWIDGEIFANVWESDRIAVIDPETGVVKRQIECKGLVEESDPWIREFSKSDRCLNGIAWDAKQKRLFVTGKLWTKIYEIAVLPGMGEMMKERDKPNKNDYYGGSKGAAFDPLGMK